MGAGDSASTREGRDGRGRAAEPLPGAAASVAEHCRRPSRCPHAPRPSRAPAGALQVPTCSMHLQTAGILPSLVILITVVTVRSPVSSICKISFSRRQHCNTKDVDSIGSLGDQLANVLISTPGVQGRQGMGRSIRHGGRLRVIQAAYAAAAAALCCLCGCFERGEPRQLVCCFELP